jgi:hypothetical protein
LAPPQKLRLKEYVRERIRDRLRLSVEHAVVHVRLPAAYVHDYVEKRVRSVSGVPVELEDCDARIGVELKNSNLRPGELEAGQSIIRYSKSAESNGR